MGEEGSEIHVLHVDDDEHLLELTATFLARDRERLTVRTETSTTAALDRLAEEPIDCVVCDYNMPGMDGLEFLEAVREEYPDLPVVLFTGRGNEEIASQAISAGVTDYLQKGTGTDQYVVLANRIVNSVERYRAERDRRESEAERELYVTMLEAAADPMCAIDIDGRFLYVNEALASLTDHDPETLVGEPAECVVADESREAAREHVASLYTEDVESATFELSLVTASGERIPAENRVAPFPRGADQHRGHVAVIRDITERMRRERELERQNERLEEFASVVSHDLRNPLNVVGGSIDLARETGDLDELDRAEHALDRADALIDDLLALAREGEVVDEPAPVDLAAVARDAWATVETDGATLSVDVEHPIVADRSRLSGLLENLFSNAVEHGGPDVTVRVAGLDDGGFSVADDGPSIPEAERERVFDAGYSTAVDGTGFGLAIVHEIAEAHGWSVSVSESAEGGARFEFTGVERPKDTDSR